ncbi:MAG: 23S rRNA (cytosine(1962)-C(5))-methyltransferase RlmI [Deltaproteobacteria bacterium]|nr:23S rRNA (cytosine(1962)-C(5))-methyltransferase RlmI [Deltaproteobacteria bacterium]
MENEVCSIRLKAGREKSLLRRHPWIFSGAVQEVMGIPGHGDTIRVLDSRGNFLAWAAWSPASQIRARIWSFDPEESVDTAFFRRRLEAAVRARTGLVSASKAPGIRLVNAESDGLPGLVVDRYDGFLVVSFLSAGAEAWRETVVEGLSGLGPWDGIYERSEAEVRRKEGLQPRAGLLAGAEPPARIEIVENGLRFLVDVRKGHKTGFYLDQRENRAAMGRFVHSGGEVLNCFSYSGGFGLAALAAGSGRVVHLDSSAEALDLCRASSDLNGFLGASEYEEADVFSRLRAYRAEGRRFDLVILDPPKFADSKAHVERAARGYKDINLLAMGLARPGGFVITFSCSGLVDASLFQKIVAGAALDSGRRVRIVGRMTQAADHPVDLAFPEGEYLKGLVLAVD